jgi:hypothetical protein
MAIEAKTALLFVSKPSSARRKSRSCDDGDGAAGKTDSHCALPVDDEPARGVAPLLLLLLRAGGTGSSVSGR